MKDRTVQDQPTILIPRLLASFLVPILLFACQSNNPIIEDQSISALNSIGTVYSSVPETIDPNRRYLFYIHGKIIEDEGVNAVSPDFGPYEFEEILSYFADAGFDVIAEVRPTPTDVNMYAERVSGQVNSLLEHGVLSDSITIVGFSKGAGIALLASAKLQDPDLKYVLIAICGEEINSNPGLILTGRILSLYEKSDEFGSTCKPLVDRSPEVMDFEEIEFATGKEHGAFYSADPIWLDPITSWIDEVEKNKIGPAPAGPSLGDTRTRPADGMVMVYVPGGEFRMGSTVKEVDDALARCNAAYGDCQPGWFEPEQPAHTIALDGFWIDRTEVSNAQFAAFLNEEGNQEEEGVTWLELESDDCLIEQVGDKFWPKDDYAEHPVVEVNWYGAAAYCAWAGARLPTEAEWEYAARGPERHIYSWGDELDGTRLNYCDRSCELGWADVSFDDGYARTAPVGSYPDGASWVGALDLSGNAWEWTADWFGDYGSGREENPTGPSTGHFRVVRGGGWTNYWDHGRTAHRSHGSPIPRYHIFGFRCAASAVE